VRNFEVEIDVIGLGGSVFGNDDGGEVGVINVLICAFESLGVDGVIIDDLVLSVVDDGVLLNCCGCLKIACFWSGNVDESIFTCKAVPTTSISVWTSRVISGT